MYAWYLQNEDHLLQMEVGVVKVADDLDFEKLKQLLDNHNGWKLDYSKDAVKVWTKSVVDTSFKMIKVWTTFADVVPLDLYDVLHDPDYRRIWDLNMIESHDIGYLNPNNDVGYYAMSCPAPLKNRDFVLQRSWLDTGQEQYIINHSVHHKNYPPRKEYVRATSYLTGFLIRPSPEGAGSMLGYVSQTDPHGTLPPWLVNKCTQILAPKMVKKLYKASRAYADWKKLNNPNFKPWHFPEQITSPRISIQDCVISTLEASVRNKDGCTFDEQCDLHSKH
ncbi:START domain-containing protein 10-like isoform X3 [Schistocerca serialis cubense]|uniref:START domain-containing protein 10-like isoform X3 n=1 Tax=Schistocerca serialis cubense TaxID=2023355 RepID=UPI00214E754E|nr:START domain-containing protein 10-like isoform X3 [Schistocerca serialis cubense]